MGVDFMPIEPDQSAAYFNAAIAVTATTFDLPVRQLSLKILGGRRFRPKLMLFSEYLPRRGRIYASDRCLREYVTVLLSGSVGRMLAIEEYLGLPRNPDAA